MCVRNGFSRRLECRKAFILDNAVSKIGLSTPTLHGAMGEPYNWRVTWSSFYSEGCEGELCTLEGVVAAEPTAHPMNLKAGTFVETTVEQSQLCCREA